MKKGAGIVVAMKDDLPEVAQITNVYVTFDYYCVLIGAWYLTSCVYAFLCAHIDWE